MSELKPLDVKSLALRPLSWVLKVLGQDLEALPEDAFDRSFGGKTRSVADMMQEVILTQDHIRLIITGETPFDWPDGWIPTAPEDRKTKEAVVNAFKASSEAFLEAVRGFTADELVEPLEIDGAMTDRYERCRYVAWHGAYHSGQIGFIQRLLGDDGWHWN